MLHRAHDLGIGGAATEIAREIVADLILARIGICREQLPRHQDKARRAKAALESAGLDEGLLHRIERLALLHGLDPRAVDERREIEAARHGFAVDQHGAAAAQALAAAFARAEKVEALLQQLDERQMGFDRGRDRLAIEGEADLHHASFSGSPCAARSARRIVSGRKGSEVRRTPTASSMALAMAGETPKVALSPTPLAPKGPLCSVDPTASFSIVSGKSRKPGIL